MSLLLGVRRSISAFYEETNRELCELVLDEDDFLHLCYECGVSSKDIPDYLEIDGIVVRAP